MKKENLAKLALMGLATGVLAANGIEAFHNNPNTQGMIASGCSGKSGCSNIASGCSGKNGCSSVASKCGSKCGAVASGCGGKGCNAIADKCGSKCNHIAENDPKKSLTSPAPIPKTGEYSKGLLKTSDSQTDLNLNDQNIGYHLLSEDELTLELNDESLKLYQQMTPETKALARLVASARCNGTNECSGLNACKTEKNACAGKGGCKGTGKCAFSDKNLAVRVVAEKMKAKRQELTK